MDKPITENRDVQRLISETVKLHVDTLQSRDRIIELEKEAEELQVQNAKLRNILNRGIGILESWKKLKERSE